MFVSRKKWNALTKRVEELEKTVNPSIDSEKLEAAIKKFSVSRPLLDEKKIMENVGKSAFNC